VRPSRLRSGIIFIGLGVSLLLYNMDRLDGYYFADLIQLWPVLLIGIGIEILARHSNAPLVGYLSPLLVAGAFIYAGYGGTGFSQGDWSMFHSESEPSRMRMVERSFEVDSSVDQARFYIDLYSGRIHIEGGAEPLGRGEFRSHGKVRTSMAEKDGLAVVRVRQSGASRDEEAEFDMFLADGLPLTLDLKARDAVVELDGEHLSVRTLYLEIGSGLARITLGTNEESVWAQLTAGDADLSFRLPLGAGVRFEGPFAPAEGRLGDQDLQRVQDRLETAGFDSAAVKFIFQVEEPLASVKLETY
jgi:hypothetical protein